MCPHSCCRGTLQEYFVIPTVQNIRKRARYIMKLSRLLPNWLEPEAVDIHERWKQCVKNCARQRSSLSATVNINVGDGVDNDEMNDADRCQTCCGNFTATVCNKTSTDDRLWSVCDASCNLSWKQLTTVTDVNFVFCTEIKLSWKQCSKMKKMTSFFGRSSVSVGI